MVAKKQSQHGRFFSLLRLFHDIFVKLDREFLKRQQTYHLVASATLPKLRGDAGELRILLTELLTFIAGRAPAGEDISMTTSEALLHNTPGIEVVLIAKDTHSRGVDESMAECRKRIATRGGQLSCEIGKHSTLLYRLFLPVTKSGMTVKNRQMYRYDITIKHFMRLRKNFGIKPCTGLVHRIAEAITPLIRQPPDVVVTNDDEGKLATFYEAGSGGAESVASRISRRLASEHFQVGKKNVPIEFEYVLVPLQAAARPGKGTR